MLQNSLPRKATCSYLVGLSGLSCHILALLLFVKHNTDTNEKTLELTYTELQNIYRTDPEDLKKDPYLWYYGNKSIQNKLA